jgi:hypothetical protein
MDVDELRRRNEAKADQEEPERLNSTPPAGPAPRPSAPMSG